MQTHGRQTRKDLRIRPFPCDGDTVHHDKLSAQLCSLARAINRSPGRMRRILRLRPVMSTLDTYNDIRKFTRHSCSDIINRSVVHPPALYIFIQNGAWLSRATAKAVVYETLDCRIHSVNQAAYPRSRGQAENESDSNPDGDRSISLSHPALLNIAS